jgi:hypothetical protein
METSVEKLTALCFLLIGLSHIVQPRAWVQFFIMLREKQEVGSFLNGFAHLSLGAFIVAFHNVWHGIPMIVTIVGLGLVIKSSIYFTCPRHGVRMLGTISLERSWHFCGGRGDKRRAQRFESLSAPVANARNGCGTIDWKTYER